MSLDAIDGGACRAAVVVDSHPSVPVGKHVPGQLTGQVGEARGLIGRVPSRSVPVTLVFTDIEDSIGLREADREAMAEVSARHDRIVREQIEGAGGKVFKTVGEAFRAVFAGPSAALASAVAVERAVGAEPWPPGLPMGVRVAVHPEACVERDGGYSGPSGSSR